MNPNNSWFVKKHFQVPCQFVWGTLHMLNWLKLSSIKTFLPTLIACDKKVRLFQPFFCAKKLDALSTLSGAETLAQQCLLSIVFKKSSGANSNCQKSMLLNMNLSWESFWQISQHVYDNVLFLFLKGWVSPLLSQPGFFLKSSILTGVSMVTLGHLFQRLGHLRRSLRMASQVVFIGEMVYIYIYIYDQQPLLLKQRYIYIYVF